MALKPWYDVVKPREDLREGKPLDASEFAVHLDHVRDSRAPDDYQKPDRFFDRTFLTSSLSELGSGVVRRLSGIKLETSRCASTASKVLALRTQTYCSRASRGTSLIPHCEST